MGKSCRSAAQSFVDCIKKSQCMKDGGTLRACVNKGDDLEGGECKVVVVVIVVIVIVVVIVVVIIMVVM
jgi:hypothetical protein